MPRRIGRVCVGYREANASALAASVATRVVFMGDSITESWALADPVFFDRGVVNRGISGQTTAQMLVRFRADVVALRPKIVHILGGTNDVAGNTGPTSAQDFKNNIMSMVEIARANGIDVILGSLPPAAAFYLATGVEAHDHNQRAQRMAARLFGAATDHVHRLLHGPCWSGRGAQVRFGERWRASEPKGLHCHAASRRREVLRPTTLGR